MKLIGKIFITLGLVGVVLLFIWRDYDKVKGLLSKNFIVSHIVIEQNKVKAKARAITLNQLRPTFSEFVAYDASGGEARLTWHYAKYYEKMTEFMPHRAEAHGLLGFCYYLDGKYREAIESLQRAAALDAQFFWFPYNLGVIYFHDGQYPQAIRFLQMALKLKPQETLKTIAASKIYAEMIWAGQGFNHTFAFESNLQAGYRDAYTLLTVSSQLLANPNDSSSLLRKAVQIPLRAF